MLKVLIILFYWVGNSSLDNEEELFIPNLQLSVVVFMAMGWQK